MPRRIHIIFSPNISLHERRHFVYIAFSFKGVSSEMAVMWWKRAAWKNPDSFSNIRIPAWQAITQQPEIWYLEKNSATCWCHPVDLLAFRNKCRVSHNTWAIISLYFLWNNRYRQQDYSGDLKQQISQFEISRAVMALQPILPIYPAARKPILCIDAFQIFWVAHLA